MSRFAWGRILPGAGLALLVLAAYLPALDNGFIWDDETYITGNPNLLDASGLRSIWFDLGATEQYYPLVHTAFWIQRRLWGTDPVGYHLANILLHAINASLLLVLLRRLKIGLPWAAAAVFALHPLQVESVAWASELKNLLSGFFYLAALLQYMDYLGWREDGAAGSGGRKGGRRAWALALVLFACALLSKTVAATLPAAVIVLIWWKRGRVVLDDLAPLVPFIILGAAAGLTTAWMEWTFVGARGEPWSLSFPERLQVAGRAAWFYAGKMLFPAGLSFNYPRWSVGAGLWRPYLYPAAAILAMAALWRLRGRMGRGPMAAAACYLVILAPALGFFDVYPMRYSFVADHFQYLAGAGMMVLLTGALGWGLGRFLPGKREAGRALLAAGLVLLGVLTRQRCFIFRDSETLWRDTLDKNPGSWLAHNNLGAILDGRGLHDEGAAHFREALVIMPDDPATLFNLGLSYSLAGRLSEAETILRRVLAIEPGGAKTHSELGLVMLEQGRTGESMEEFRRAMAADPSFWQGRFNMGLALFREGRYREAADEMRAVLEVQAGHPGALYHLALALDAEGLRTEARAVAARLRAAEPRLADEIDRLTGQAPAAPPPPSR